MKVFAMRKYGAISRVVLSVGIITCATCACIPFDDLLGDASPFLIYWPSIVLVAVWLGLLPTLLAILVAPLEPEPLLRPAQDDACNDFADDYPQAHHSAGAPNDQRRCYPQRG